MWWWRLWDVGESSGSVLVNHRAYDTIPKGQAWTFVHFLMKDYVVLTKKEKFKWNKRRILGTVKHSLWGKTATARCLHRPAWRRQKDEQQFSVCADGNVGGLMGGRKWMAVCEMFHRISCLCRTHTLTHTLWPTTLLYAKRLKKVQPPVHKKQKSTHRRV